MKKRHVSGSLALAIAMAAPVTAQQPSVGDRHLVALPLAQERLIDVEERRASDLAAVSSFIHSDAGSAALAPLGVSAAAAAAGAAALGDAELAEIATRVHALQADPVAGQSSDRGWTWWAAAGLAAVLLIVLIT